MIIAKQDWEVRKIIGKEDISGVLHYLVEWSPTLAPGHLLGHAKELVDKFKVEYGAGRAQTSPRDTPQKALNST